jgi:hypothetical protein
MGSLQPSAVIYFDHACTVGQINLYILEWDSNYNHLPDFYHHLFIGMYQEFVHNSDQFYMISCNRLKRHFLYLC